MEAGVEEGEKELGSVEVGGIWTLGCVEKCCQEDSDWKEVKSKRNKKEKAKHERRMNNFHATSSVAYPCLVEEVAKKDTTKDEKGWPCLAKAACLAKASRSTKAICKKGDTSAEGPLASQIVEEEGRVWIQAVQEVEEQKKMMMNLNFQVAEVKKPLVAVKRIVEKGNYVCFGPEEKDNYIVNKRSGG